MTISASGTATNVDTRDGDTLPSLVEFEYVVRVEIKAALDVRAPENGLPLEVIVRCAVFKVRADNPGGEGNFFEAQKPEVKFTEDAGVDIDADGVEEYSDQNYPAGSGYWKAWKKINKPGTVTTTASDQGNEVTDKRNFPIADSLPPHSIIFQNIVDQQTQFAPSEDGSDFEVLIQAFDHFSGVKAVEAWWDGQGAAKVSLNAVPSVPQGWAGKLPCSGTPLGLKALVAVATDWAGNVSIQYAIQIVVVDRTPPVCTLRIPRRVPWDGEQTVVPFTVLATDRQSGVKSIKVTLVNQSTGVAVASDVHEIHDPAPASAAIEFTTALKPGDSGYYLLRTACIDAAGNLREETSPSIEVTREFKPNAAELLGLRQYLADLIDFLKVHVAVKDRSNGNVRGLTIGDLEQALRRPYGLLTTDKDLADMSVNEARLCVELLGQEASGLPVRLQPYLQATYERLLVECGTSFAELRLLRGAGADRRERLAQRLGLGDLMLADWDQALNDLTLDPAQLTEQKLEALFGLKVTLAPTTLLASTAAVAATQSMLATKRESAQRAAWVRRDDTLPFLILDPDLVELTDFQRREPADAAFGIWSRRFQALLARLEALRNARSAETTPINSLRAALRITYPDPGPWPAEDGDALGHLKALAQKQDEEGRSIAIELNALSLSLLAWRALMRVTALCETEPPTVTPAEWATVDDILVQVWKAQQTLEWRGQERAVQLSLSPAWFKLDDGGWPALPSTGLRNGLQLPQGVQDPLWSLIATPAGVPSGAAAQLYVGHRFHLWVVNDGRSQWLSGKLGGDGLNDAGTYVYRTTIDLSGWDITTVSLIAEIAVDNTCTVELNGQATGIAVSDVHQSYLKFTSFELPSQLLKPEVNDLRFHVFNAPGGADNPWGLRVALSYATAPQRQRQSIWRAPVGARDDWLDVLQVRIEQQSALRQAGLAAVAATEIATLPILRDALLAALAARDRQAPVGTAEAWARLLFIETRGRAWRSTTRALQAAESLQSLVLALQADLLPPDHPAASWLIGEEAGGQGPFPEEEWGWIGGYDTWRSAVLVYLYPENLLLPALWRLHIGVSGARLATKAFGLLITGLRATARLTADKAKTLADTYRASLKVEPDGYSLPVPSWDGLILNPEISDASLVQLAKEALTHTSQDHPPALREIFSFVPMALALELQKAGEYVAALAWFRLVYAYDLPKEVDRKIDPWIAKENNGPLALNRAEHWLREPGMDPHALAADRQGWNPYTRFTLMCLARCLADYADAEFARDTGDALANARLLYSRARDLLSLPELRLVQKEGGLSLLPNPVPQMLLDRMDSRLGLMRQGLNIAGMKRDLDPPVPPALVAGLPPVGAGTQLPQPGPRAQPKPTPYRYAVLIERAKQLVGIAQQVESAYLAALEKKDAEGYTYAMATGQLALATAGVELQKLRVSEAGRGISMAEQQKTRASEQQRAYQGWIEEGTTTTEKALYAAYAVAGTAQIISAGLSAGITISQAWQSVATAGISAGAAAPAATTTTVLAGIKAGSDAQAIVAQTAAQVLSLSASIERRQADWELAASMAGFDIAIAEQQRLLATDRKGIVEKEQAIAEQQQTQADAMAKFLATKFTNADLYDWMGGVLGGVYAYFLQQATSAAALAEAQLRFERQDAVDAAFILSDYWAVRPDGAQADNGAKATDRQGLTGSARLLQDIYSLDQYAFDSNKRKLNLSHTFSLATLDAVAFARFRETGVLGFTTPMRHFDESFPGHYLRLIKRVRTSVVALIPPIAGIRATLAASGISRVVGGPDSFQEIVLRRDPERVAFTSPVNATGVFELDAQAELLMPFESMGVDTTWEFSMPRAANAFDFNAVADVLVTLDYTALQDDRYRNQVISTLDRRASAERLLSVANDLPDVWYALCNGDSATGGEIAFDNLRSQFPLNWQGKDDELLATSVSFYVLPRDDGAVLEGGVALDPATDDFVPLTENIISTHRGSGLAWQGAIDRRSVIGRWRYVLSPELTERFRNDEVADVLIVTGATGVRHAWVI